MGLSVLGFPTPAPSATASERGQDYPVDANGPEEKGNGWRGWREKKVHYIGEEEEKKSDRGERERERERERGEK